MIHVDALDIFIKLIFEGKEKFLFFDGPRILYGKMFVFIFI